MYVEKLRNDYLLIYVESVTTDIAATCINAILLNFLSIYQTDDSSNPGIAARTSVLCSQTTAVPTPRAGGAKSTVSFISGLTLGLIAMVAFLLKA